jgi:alkanesulfonate monooxygenase SsuD/methylene tetrahydromethanopterin reductase-like flavin-dependent oxidoreductase (luciferase family)
LKFGVYVGPMYPGEMDAAEAFELARAMASTAHESGFDGIFAAHHYALGPSHQMFHPFTTLARLAADCPGGYLGTACFILPLAHPLGVAEATATLDVISGGRLLFGVGQGYRVPEFQSFRHRATPTRRAVGRRGESDSDALGRRSRFLRRPLLPLRRDLDQPETDPTPRPAGLGGRGYR